MREGCYCEESGIGNTRNMKTKLLVFFGIILIGASISLFTLIKREQNRTLSHQGSESSPTEQSGPSSSSRNSADRGAQNGGSRSSMSSSANRSATPENSGSGNRTAAGSGASASPDGSSPVSRSAIDPRAPFPESTETPDGVVGTLANQILRRDFSAFVDALGDLSIPDPVLLRLKALIENPNLRLDPKRPFWEVAKTKSSVRWMFNFVPVPGKEKEVKPNSVVVDLNQIEPKKFEVAKVDFPPSLQEVIASVQGKKPPNTESSSGSQGGPDALTVAHAFSTAVLSEDFISARKLCHGNVTDERIAGLMIALEEGRFSLRGDRPLIVTLSRDDITWVLSRVLSGDQTSEFALELEKLNSWMVNGLTFGKVISALAKDAKGPYSPIVEDPSGGESLVVYFDFDNSGLTSRAESQLKIVAGILKRDKTRKIRITGHADALGSEDYNRGLSRERAESIRQAIISRGALPSQVITEGYGETRPRKPNFKEDGSDNPTGRSLNRRAEVYLDF